MITKITPSTRHSVALTVRDGRRAVIRMPGRQGAAGAGSTIVDFSFDSASPMVILPLAAGAVVLDAMMQIVTPFDDPAASLTLGTAADASRFLGSGDNLPAQVGGYGNDLPQYFPVAETIRLFISPGSSTQGAGKIIVRHQ